MGMRFFQKSLKLPVLGSPVWMESLELLSSAFHVLTREPVLAVFVAHLDAENLEVQTPRCFDRVWIEARFGYRTDVSSNLPAENGLFRLLMSWHL